jgi:D-amino peptidase
VGYQPITKNQININSFINNDQGSLCTAALIIVKFLIKMEIKMKLLIAVDMEGISGVVDWTQVDSNHPEYQRFRRIMTADVNAAIAGAVQAGADDIIVSDGHAHARNILIEELDPHALLNSGSPSPLSMVQGVDSGINAAFFIGYHAHMSTPLAILAHTWSSAKVSNVWLNGNLVGEIGLNASMCGHYAAPVFMVTGDQAACNEASHWIQGVEVVPVKKASGRQAAECLPLKIAHQRIEETAQRAVRNYLDGKSPAPLKTDSPVKIIIEFMNTVLTDTASINPSVNRLDGRRAEVVGEDMPTAYRAFRAAVMLAG